MQLSYCLQGTIYDLTAIDFVRFSEYLLTAYLPVSILSVLEKVGRSPRVNNENVLSLLFQHHVTVVAFKMKLENYNKEVPSSMSFRGTSEGILKEVVYLFGS